MRPLEALELRVRKARASIELIRLVRNPSRLDTAFGVMDALVDDATRAGHVASASRHEQGRAALAERPRFAPRPLAELLAYPEGSLGRAYGEHMQAGGIDPTGLPQRPAHDPHSYVLPHLIETHDVWHTLTGFGTDVEGELGLMAFYMAQGPGKGPLAFVIAGLLHTLFWQMHEKEARLAAIARGWAMGKRARPLFGVRWDEWLSRPLAEARAHFAIDLSIPS